MTTATWAAPAVPAAMPVYAAYRQCIRENLARPPEQWTFRADPRYTAILEHTTPAQAAELLTVAEEAAGTRWPGVRAVFPALAAANDRYGTPPLHPFPQVGATCAPANARYLAHAALLLAHVGALGLERMRIVEIGGGYGGLAFYVQALAHRFGVALDGYRIHDLPEAERLQSRFAAAVGFALGWDAGPETPAYAVSAYAFSEFDRATRDWYAAHVLRQCPHGWMVWNGAATGQEPPYPFVDAPMTVVPERPLTGPGNAVVTW